MCCSCCCRLFWNVLDEEVVGLLDDIDNDDDGDLCFDRLLHDQRLFYGYFDCCYGSLVFDECWLNSHIMDLVHSIFDCSNLGCVQSV